MARKNSDKKPVAVFIAALLITVIVLAVVLVIIINKGNDSKTTQSDSDTFNTQEGADDANAAEVTIVHKGRSEEITDYDSREIDFEGLKNINPDVCAWISIPGTGIDCAVVTDNDDPEYYLLNEINGLSGVFMQSYNSKDFSDRMTVLYGKKDAEGKSIFEELFKFQDGDFYKEYKYIYIYTPGNTYKYKIFAAHRAVANHLMLGFDWDVDQIYLDYLIGVLQSREISDNIDKDVEISIEDKVLTLSERVKDDEEVRFLVQGVLEK